MNKLFILIETLVLVLLPLLLFKFRPELLQYRTILLLLGFIYIIYIIINQKINHRHLGVTFKNFIPALKSVLLPTFLVLAVMFLAIPTGWDSTFFFIKEMVAEISAKPPNINFLYAIFISAPIQEIIFRSFYISRLEYISKNRYFLVIWSSVVFALLHTPFENKLFALFSFVLGIIYAENFLKYRNILAIMISHALILCAVVVQVIY